MSSVMNLLYVFEAVCLLCVSGEWIVKKNAAEVIGKGIKATLSNPRCNHSALSHAYSDIDNGCRTFSVCTTDEKGRFVERVYSCSNGTIFNEETKSCINKNEFHCNKKKPLANKTPRVRRGLNPPSYSYYNIPTTNFTCLGKALGGYYADPETDCQMFHICTPGENNSVIDIMFLCGNGTVFDQKKLVCERYGLVDCHDSALYLDEELRRIKEDEAHRKLAEVEITHIRSK